MLTEQLANQDPTAPVDNDQMVAQMTSFTMADGISQLNEKFESFAASMTSNQALQASSLIGQNVLVQGNVGYMANEGDGISGVIVNEKTVQNLSKNDHYISTRTKGNSYLLYMTALNDINYWWSGATRERSF